MGRSIGSLALCVGDIFEGQHHRVQHCHQCLCQGAAVAMVPATVAGDGSPRCPGRCDQLQQPGECLCLDPTLGRCLEGAEADVDIEG
eukprot:symbB.v1.2.008906.t1/scaffold560.1/size187392/1